MIDSAIENVSKIKSENAIENLKYNIRKLS
jgi:hypothetical protein